MLLETQEGQHGKLVGHLARANEQWKTAAEGSPALAIALGPDAYVTPSWYPTKRESGRVVPTWTYVALHVHGPLRFFHDRERLLDVVQRLTDRHEHGRAKPWKVSGAPADRIDGILKGIVGVELAIERIEGEWKASQNRSAPDQQGAIEGMGADGHQEMVRVMEEVKPGVTAPRSKPKSHASLTPRPAIPRTRQCGGR